MILNEVVSSNIRSVGYEDGNLHVAYKNGNSYVYYDVPERLYEDLLNSESKGRFMNSYIKGTYSYKRS